MTAKTFGGFVAALSLVLAGLVAVAPAASAAHLVSLHGPHQGVSVDDPSFAEDGADCGGLDPADGAVIHFVANGLAKDSSAGSIVVTHDGGATTAAQSADKVLKKTQHFYVQIAGAEVIDNAVVTFAADSDQSSAKLVISHICAGDTPTSSS